MKKGRLNLVLSERGQITLPSQTRKKYGLEEGDILTMEEKEGGLFLKPSTIVDLELYSGEQIAQWDKLDHLTAQQKQKMNKKLPKNT